MNYICGTYFAACSGVLQLPIPDIDPGQHNSKLVLLEHFETERWGCM
jgi:hypothetical protein